MDELLADTQKLVMVKLQTGKLPDGSVWIFPQIGGVTRVLASTRELALKKLGTPPPVQHGNWSRVYMGGHVHIGLLRHIPTNTLVCPDDFYSKTHMEQLKEKLKSLLSGDDLQFLEDFAGMINGFRHSR